MKILMTVLALLTCCVGSASAKDFDVARFGAVADDGKDDSAAVQTAIDECKKEPGSRLVFHKGRYDFFYNQKPSDCLLFVGLHDLSIVGPGAELVFHGLVHGLSFYDCSNISIQGLTIDWDRLPFSEGTVVARPDDVTIDVQVDPKFPVTGGEKVQAMMEFDPATGLPARKMVYGNSAYVVDQYDAVKTAELVGPQRLRLHLNYRMTPGPAVGALLILRHQVYGYNAFEIVGGSHFTLRDIRIYAAPGMGMWTRLSSDFVIRNVNVMIRPGSGRHMSTCADGLHFLYTSGTVDIADCLFEGLGDDAINIHGIYLAIDQVVDDHTISVCNDPCAPQVADLVEFSHPTLTPIARDVVKSVTPQGGKLLIGFADPLPAGLAPGDTIFNRSRIPKAHISGCTARANRARGFLIGAAGGIIEKNTFDHCTGEAIQVWADDSYWKEGPGTTDLCIRLNQIHGVNYGAAMSEAAINVYAEMAGGKIAAAGVHQRIFIDQNTIDDTTLGGIRVTSASTVFVINNTITRCCQQKATPREGSESAPIILENVQDAQINANRIADFPSANKMVLLKGACQKIEMEGKPLDGAAPGPG